MNFDLVHIFEFSLISVFVFGIILRVVLILDADLSVLVVLASEQDMLFWLNFQVVAASKRMNLSFEAFCVFDGSGLGFVAQSDGVDTLLRNDQEIVAWQKEAFDWAFPKLEALVPELDESCLQAENENVEGVDTDAFVADNDVVDVIPCKHLNVTVCYFKLVFPFDKVVLWLTINIFVLRGWILNINLEKIVSQPVELLVG
jgi:hypothetical protein